MLHELDHGRYYYYPDWRETLVQRKVVRLVEFALRLVIAFLFIKLELSLHDLNKYTKNGTKIYDCGDVIQTIATTRILLICNAFGLVSFCQAMDYGEEG